MVNPPGDPPGNHPPKGRHEMIFELIPRELWALILTVLGTPHGRL